MFGGWFCCANFDETNPPANSNLTLKPKWKAGVISLRGHLVRTYHTDIEKDYFIDREHELGKGGCGVVVVGEHKDTHSQYAIKIVNKSTAERGRLDRELKLMKDVDHTNIVRLFSVYDVPGNMYFVMELCLGGHLGNLLARQPNRYVDEAWAKKLCRQILSAVAHIHQRGIAHRDIKLQNILIDSTNDRTAQVKLIDFGYGSRFVGALPMRTKCGTPYTTAPEVIRECYDERCDIWSCGVVLYIMLCGRRPFEALDIAGPLSDAGKAAMITNILAGRYHFNHKPFQTVSKGAIQFVKTLLHQDYRTRVRAYETLENPWLQDTLTMQSSQSTLTSAKSFRAISNIRKSMQVTDMQRTGMVALVFGINARSAHDLRQIFQSFDRDASGTISKDEFHGALKIVCPELESEDIYRLFDIVDIDKNQTISFTEFLAATLDPREVDIEELNKAFKLLDEDGNGTITRDELTKVVRLLLEQQQSNGDASTGQQLSAAMLQEEVEAKVNEIFAQVDVNNDGHISHSEFFMAMTGMPMEEAQEAGAGYGDFDRQDSDSNSGRYGAKGSFKGRSNQATDSPSGRRHSTGGQGSKKSRGTSVATSPSKIRSRSNSSSNNNNGRNNSFSYLANTGDGDAADVAVEREAAGSPNLSHRHSISAIRMTSTKSTRQIHTVVEASEASSSKDSKSGTYVSGGGKSFTALPTTADFQETSPHNSPRPAGKGNLVFYDEPQDVSLHQHSESESSSDGEEHRDPTSPSQLQPPSPGLSAAYPQALMSPESTSRRASKVILPPLNRPHDGVGGVGDFDEKSDLSMMSISQKGGFFKSPSLKALGVGLGVGGGSLDNSGVGGNNLRISADTNSVLEGKLNKKSTSFKKQLSAKLSDRSGAIDASEERSSVNPPIVRGLSLKRTISGGMSSGIIASGGGVTSADSKLNTHEEHSEEADKERRQSFVASITRMVSGKVK